MSGRILAGLIGLVVIVFLIFSSFFIVNERQQAIVLRFGEIVGVETTPGLYFKLPFVDTVQMIDDRILRFSLDDIRLQVSGGRFYVVDAFVAYRIENPRRFRQAVSGSVQLAEQRLRTRMDAALRRVYGERGFEAALSDERADMMREVAADLRPAAEQLGLQIDDVRIRRTDLTDEVSQQTYERMQAERLAEAERLRARGREAAQRIRAAADRQVEGILAEANRDSEILRGEGDAERNSIFAQAYSADPEFFDFYRSMNAYVRALENSGTTMVLSPNSEFFRYFQGAGGVSSGADAGTGSGAGTGNGTGGGDAASGANAPQAQPGSASAAPATGAQGTDEATTSATNGASATGTSPQGANDNAAGSASGANAANDNAPAAGNAGSGATTPADGANGTTGSNTGTNTNTGTGAAAQ